MKYNKVRVKVPDKESLQKIDTFEYRQEAADEITEGSIQ